VEFKAADFPDASRMMLQMLSIFAEYEREQVSQRTKAALAARRARGFRLGNPHTLVPGASPAPELNKAQAEAERMRPVIGQLVKEGITTVRSIAAAGRPGLRDRARFDLASHRGSPSPRPAGGHCRIVGVTAIYYAASLGQII
jgi:hypothetical protein